MRQRETATIYVNLSKCDKNMSTCGNMRQTKRTNVPFIFQNAATYVKMRQHAANCGSMGGIAAIRVRCCRGSRLVAINNVMANIRAHTHC